MGEDFVELIPAYLSSVEEILEALPAAETVQNIKEMQRYSHSIKSASNNVGATTLAKLAAEMEFEAQQGQPARCIANGHASEPRVLTC